MLTILLTALLTIVAIVPANADQVTLTAARDNTIYSEDGTLSNGAGQYIVAGKNSSTNERRGLLVFDLSTIPAGSSIDQVMLTLTLDTGTPDPLTLYLHRLLGGWGEGSADAAGTEEDGSPSSGGDATWTHAYYSSVTWSATGGDYHPKNSGFETIAGPGHYNVSSSTLASDVQGWLDDPSSNHGWIMLIDQGDPTVDKMKHFRSRETAGSGPPRLVVDYTPQTIATETVPWGVIKARYR